MQLQPLLSPQHEQDRFCVVVLDLVGSTALAQQFPLPVWSELLGEWGQQMMELLRSWGGWLLPLQGDAALACWPACQVEAAVSAAQQAHQVTQQLALAQLLGQQLQLRVGLAMGELTLLPYSEPRPCGLPLHLAQRLSSVADPGETLVCAGVAQGLEAQPGLQDSILRLRPVPALRGFELLQGGGAAFYQVLPQATPGCSSEMKAG